MTLTPAQAATLKAAINNTPAWAAYPNTTDGNIDLCDMVLNKQAAPDFAVWMTNFPVSTLLDNVDQSQYTPNDAVLQSNTDVASLTRMQVRSLNCQTKLIVLQGYVIARDFINMGPPIARKSLLDALLDIPSGTNGAARNAAGPGANPGNAVFSKATRLATEVERVLCKAANASDTTVITTARVLTFEGVISPADVEFARNLP
jgi:hypothetical protein